MIIRSLKLRRSKSSILIWVNRHKLGSISKYLLKNDEKSLKSWEISIITLFIFLEILYNQFWNIISDIGHSDSIKTINKLWESLNIEIPRFLDESYLISDKFVKYFKSKTFEKFLISINEDHLIDNTPFRRIEGKKYDKFLAYIDQDTSEFIKQALASRKWWR